MEIEDIIMHKDKPCYLLPFPKTRTACTERTPSAVEGEDEVSASVGGVEGLRINSVEGLRASLLNDSGGANDSCGYGPHHPAIYFQENQALYAIYLVL